MPHPDTDLYPDDDLFPSEAGNPGGNGYSWFLLEVTSEHVPVHVDHGRLQVDIEEQNLLVFEPDSMARIQVVASGIAPGVEIDPVDLRPSAEISGDVWIGVSEPVANHLKAEIDERSYTVGVPEDSNPVVEVSSAINPGVVVQTPPPIQVQVDEE